MSRNRSQRRNTRGFALALAIWVTALLSLIVLSFATSVRVHVKVAANASSLAEAELAADGGIDLAAALLVRRALAAERPVVKPAVIACSMPGGARLLIEVTDEAGRVDLNIASEPVLRALLAGMIVDRVTAARLADAILDYRDADDDRRDAGAEAADYRAAGRTGPRNGPFASVEELGNVLGLDMTTLASLRPHITVRSGQDGVDPARVSSELADILARGRDAGGIGSGIGGSVVSATTPIGSALRDDRVPAEFRTASVGRAAGVRVTATTPRGSVFAREAVIEVIEVRPPPPRPPDIDPERGTRARPLQPAETRAFIPVNSEWRRARTPQPPPSAESNDPPC